MPFGYATKDVIAKSGMIDINLVYSLVGYIYIYWFEQLKPEGTIRIKQRTSRSIERYR